MIVRVTATVSICVTFAGYGMAIFNDSTIIVVSNNMLNKNT